MSAPPRSAGALAQAVGGAGLRPAHALGLEAGDDERRRPLLRHDARDGWLLVATAVQAGCVLALLRWADGGDATARVLASLGVAVSVWWNANTVAHIHLHRPIFARRSLNRAFAVGLSALTGVPQVVWRQRHLWHHAGEPTPRPSPRMSRQLALELVAIATLLAALALWSPATALLCWGPGFLGAMSLCQLQGVFEHRRPGGARPGGISHYARVYNWLWFNDGFHIEHHLEPACHWTALPALRARANAVAADADSALPPVLRPLEPLYRALERRVAAARNLALGALERLAIALPLLGAAMVRTHRRALGRLLERAALRPRVVVVVGGGLFPRTLLALAPLLPEARFVVVDSATAHLDEMARHLDAVAGLAARVEAHCARFDPAQHADGADLVVLPLALDGDAEALARRCACPVVVHRWVWAPAAGHSEPVARWLAKRADLIGVGEKAS